MYTPEAEIETLSPCMTSSLQFPCVYTGRSSVEITNHWRVAHHPLWAYLLLSGFYWMRIRHVFLYQFMFFIHGARLMLTCMRVCCCVFVSVVWILQICLNALTLGRLTVLYNLSSISSSLFNAVNGCFMGVHRLAIPPMYIPYSSDGITSDLFQQFYREKNLCMFFYEKLPLFHDKLFRDSTISSVRFLPVVIYMFARHDY